MWFITKKKHEAKLALINEAWNDMYDALASTFELYTQTEKPRRQVLEDRIDELENIISRIEGPSRNNVVKLKVVK